MKTQRIMSIVLLLIVGLLASVPNVNAAGHMDGSNWTGIDKIMDSFGMSYLKNNTGMSNPATADLNMGNYNITGLGQNESYSYLIWTDGTTVYAKNGSTGKIDYSGTNGNIVVSSSIGSTPSGGIVKFSEGTFNLTGAQIIISKIITLQGSGQKTGIYNMNTTAGVFRFDNLEDWFRVNGITVSDMFIGSGAIVPSGIIEVKVGRSKFENIWFVGGYYGIWEQEAGGINSYRNIIVSTNIANPAGFPSMPTNQVLFYADGNGQASMLTRLIAEGTVNGIYINCSNQGQDPMMIIGGVFEGLSGRGITIVNSLAPFIIDGAYFELNTNGAIRVENSKYVYIRNVHAYDATSTIIISNSVETVLDSIYAGHSKTIQIYANSSYTHVLGNYGNKLLDYSASTIYGVSGYTFNIEQNGNFEKWTAGLNSTPDNWGTYGTIQVNASNSDLKFGSYSAKLNSSGAPNNKNGLTFTIPTEFLPPNKGGYAINNYFLVDFWVKVTSGAVGISEWINDNGYVGGSPSPGPLAWSHNNWEHIVVLVPNHNGYVLNKIAIYLEPNSTAYIDGISIRSGYGSAWDWFLMPSKVFGTGVTNNNNGSITISSILSQCPTSLVNGSMCLNYTTGAQNNYFDGSWRYTNGTVVT